MAKSPAFRTWTKRLESGTFTAAQCRAWCRDGFERFTFTGEGIDIGNDYVSHYVPVWRVHGTAGETLDYYAAAWQSGRDVGPRILREGPRALERAQ